MRPASALNLLGKKKIRTYHMRQYCPARAKEDEQGNVHVDESGDTQKERTSGYIIRNELTA